MIYMEIAVALTLLASSLAAQLSRALGVAAARPGGERRAAAVPRQLVVSRWVDPVALVKSGYARVILVRRGGRLRVLAHARPPAERHAAVVSGWPAPREVPVTLWSCLRTAGSGYALVVEGPVRRGTVAASLYQVRSMVAAYRLRAHRRAPIRLVRALASLMAARGTPGPRVYVGRSAWGERVLAALSPHVGVFGATGAGKSTLLAVLASELRKLGYCVLLTSVSGPVPNLEGFKQLVAGANFGVDPIAALPPSRAIEVLEESSLAVHGEAGRFSPMVRALLEEALESLGSGGASQLLESLRSRALSEPREDVRRGLEALVRRLSHLRHPAFRGRGNVCELLLEHGAVALSLDAVSSAVGRCALALTVLHQVFESWHSSLPGLFIIVDEAHRLAPYWAPREPILEELMREGRGRGVTVVLSTQSIGDVHRAVRANLSTLFVFRLPDPSDSRLAASMLALSPEEEAELAAAIRRLPPATCLYWHDGSWELVRVRRFMVRWLARDLGLAASRHGVSQAELGALAERIGGGELAEAVKEMRTGELVRLGVLRVSEEGRVELTRLGRAALDYYGVGEDALAHYWALNRVLEACEAYGVSVERLTKALERLAAMAEDRTLRAALEGVMRGPEAARLKLVDAAGRLTKLGRALLDLAGLGEKGLLT